ncbi:unnamed protein product [Arctia plantaginis]|uniref:DUF4795 domain-containing protein n=1 Tax=Arctia plantaginis TaxID=874455 RepID=A0A8S0ZWQ4_ARCPL|nr:unnamed protein product [Arctia plantaginis]
MTAKTALINIAEMIDLSIGTPENGTVDFVMLHTVLHCLAQQLRCTDKIVEVRGPLAVFPVGRQVEDAATTVVDEFLIETDGQAAGPGEQDKTILVVERLLKNQRVPLTAPKATPSSIGIDASGGITIRPIEGGAKETITKPSRKITVADGGGIVEDGSKQISDVGAGGTEGEGAKQADGGASPAPGASGPTAEGSGAVGGETTAVAGEVPGGEPASGTPSKSAGINIVPTGSAQRLGVPSGERLSLVSLNRFNQLQKSVDDLKSRVYGTPLNNEELLEGVRSQTNLKGITDMWTSLNVSSRLEAAEAGIAKLSSLMQDLIGKDVLLPKAEDMRVKGTSSQPITLPAEGTSTVPISSGMPPECATKEELAQLILYLKSLQDELNHLSGAFYNTMKDMGQELEPPPKQEMVLPTVVVHPTQTTSIQSDEPVGGTHVTTPIATEATSPEVTQATTPSATQTTTPIETPPRTPAPAARQVTVSAGKKRAESPSAGADANSKIASLSGKLKDLERKVNEITNIVFPPSGNILNQLNALQDQVEQNARLQYNASDTCTGAAAPGPSPELLKDLKGLMSLYKTVHTMQNQLKEVHDTALQLVTEKEERQHNINSLLEQIELLKAIKLDREDMTAALADKADLRVVARKVSHDQFEMACDDLAKGLEHALGKLNVQESLWQQALDDIQREIEMKLDRVELAPIKDFFIKKMKQLQDNLKQMANLRREAEAAGTKSKLLKDVNCISCDAKAYMQTEAGPAVPPKPLQPSMSMRPYLTYELDAIRKSQSSNVPHRNMHDWEKIDKQMTTPRVQKVRSETDKHLCNRYCGGSHTTTTPAQRVARLGHFVKQWGPEVLPLTSGFATGDDGKIYKVSGVEDASVGPGGAINAPCTPKPVAKKDRQAAKPSLTPDCRCLGDVLPPKK